MPLYNPPAPPKILNKPVAAVTAPVPTSVLVNAAINRAAEGLYIPHWSADETRYFMDRMAQIESGKNPSVTPSTSSAKGTYQFTDSTWNLMVKNYGKRLGVDSTTASTDIRASAIMAARFTADNYYPLHKAFPDIKIGPTELYLAHFLGAKKAVLFLNKMLADPNLIAGADEDFAKETRSNPGVFKDGTSFQDIYQRFSKMLHPRLAVEQVASREATHNHRHKRRHRRAHHAAKPEALFAGKGFDGQPKAWSAPEAEKVGRIQSAFVGGNLLNTQSNQFVLDNSVKLAFKVEGNDIVVYQGNQGHRFHISTNVFNKGADKVTKAGEHATNIQIADKNETAAQISVGNAILKRFGLQNLAGNFHMEVARDLFQNGIKRYGEALRNMGPAAGFQRQVHDLFASNHQSAKVAVDQAPSNFAQQKEIIKEKAKAVSVSLREHGKNLTARLTAPRKSVKEWVNEKRHVVQGGAAVIHRTDPGTIVQGRVANGDVAQNAVALKPAPRAVPFSSYQSIPS